MIWFQTGGILILVTNEEHHKNILNLQSCSMIRFQGRRILNSVTNEEHQKNI